MIIIPLFAIPAIKTNIGREFTEDELQLLISNVSMQPYESSKSTSHNRQSLDLYLFNTFAEELKEIKNYCQHQLKQYLEDIEGVDTDISNLRITQSWLNKTEPQEGHHPHHHPNSYLSGVLYIKCLPNDNIVFSNRMHGFAGLEFPKKKITGWCDRNLTQNVKEGDLLLFPSWTIHYVNYNMTKDQERISLSFNTFPQGNMGEYFEASQLVL